jgi:biotin-dependent carboxylase-like uncharacterized protein
MDWAAFRTVHQALGNPPDAAAIEISIGGIEVTVEDPLDLAFCGGGFHWTRDGKPLPDAFRLRLNPGERLSAKPGLWGAWAYLAAAGGFDRPPEMGSRSTHLRSGIGGAQIKDGDRLPVADASVPSLPEATLRTPWLDRDQRPIRVLLGPQDDYFTEEALTAFFANPFTLTVAADRMAYRFDGPKIDHRSGFNIVSDGIALGAIQIGGDGQPLILMADHQPTGGYPKLGYVIRADIGRLAQMRPGKSCGFAPCGMAEARAALFTLEDDIAALICVQQTSTATLTSERLRSLNLIDGVVDTPKPRD